MHSLLSIPQFCRKNRYFSHSPLPSKYRQRETERDRERERERETKRDRERDKLEVITAWIKIGLKEGLSKKSIKKIYFGAVARWKRSAAVTWKITCKIFVNLWVRLPSALGSLIQNSSNGPASCAHSFACSLTHSRAREKNNDEMAIFAVFFFLFWTMMGYKSRRHLWTTTVSCSVV